MTMHFMQEFQTVTLWYKKYYIWYEILSIALCLWIDGVTMEGRWCHFTPFAMFILPPSSILSTFSLKFSPSPPQPFTLHDY